MSSGGASSRISNGPDPVTSNGWREPPAKETGHAKELLVTSPTGRVSASVLAVGNRQSATMTSRTILTGFMATPSHCGLDVPKRPRIGLRSTSLLFIEGELGIIEPRPPLLIRVHKGQFDLLEILLGTHNP